MFLGPRSMLSRDFLLAPRTHRWDKLNLIIRLFETLQMLLDWIDQEFGEFVTLKTFIDCFAPFPIIVRKMPFGWMWELWWTCKLQHRVTWYYHPSWVSVGPGECDHFTKVSSALFLLLFRVVSLAPSLFRLPGKPGKCIDGYTICHQYEALLFAVQPIPTVDRHGHAHLIIIQAK